MGGCFSRADLQLLSLRHFDETAAHSAFAVAFRFSGAVNFRIYFAVKWKLWVISLFKLIFRLAGYSLLAGALLAMIADGSKSIAQSKLILVPLGQFWFEHAPESLGLAQAAVQRHVNPFLWDPVIQTILTWPIWSVLIPLGLIFLWLGAKRRKRRDAFA